MKKQLEQLADLLSEHPLWLLASAGICLLLAAALFVNQIYLDRSVHARLLAETTTAPQIHWYEERTTAPQAEASVQTIETEPAFDYVLNTSSKKIHRPDCRYAESLKAENRAEASEGQLPGLLADGYTYCSVCCGG